MSLELCLQKRDHTLGDLENGSLEKTVRRFHLSVHSGILISILLYVSSALALFPQLNEETNTSGYATMLSALAMFAAFSIGLISVQLVVRGYSLPSLRALMFTRFEWIFWQILLVINCTIPLIGDIISPAPADAVRYNVDSMWYPVSRIFENGYIFIAVSYLLLLDSMPHTSANFKRMLFGIASIISAYFCFRCWTKIVNNQASLEVCFIYCTNSTAVRSSLMATFAIFFGKMFVQSLRHPANLSLASVSLFFRGTHRATSVVAVPNSVDVQMEPRPVARRYIHSQV